MDDLELTLYPDPLLRKRSKDLTDITDETRAIVERMFEMMYEERGVGLAAPQAGLGLRLFVMNCTGEKSGEIAMINPKIVSATGKWTDEEGCLSLPGLTAKVTRAPKVKVAYTDLEGRGLEMEGEELLARCIQHEMDHIDGILFIDRMTPAARAALKNQLKHLEEEYHASA